MGVSLNRSAVSVPAKVWRLPPSSHALFVLFWAMTCNNALAETWYRWTDSRGSMQITKERPPLGVPHTTLNLPDSIPWRNPPAIPRESGTGQSLSVQEMFRKASGSVYWIRRVATRRESMSQGDTFGSAVAISDDLALTNCHVLGNSDNEAILGSAGSSDQFPVEVVGANIEADRCIVRVRGTSLRPVTGVRPFDSLEIGEPVYAIGNPQGLQRTVSDGLLSGIRMLNNQRMLQTTAPISPGSSGGGLFDARGNLLGITTSMRVNSQNINFAIPAEDFWK